MMDPMTSVPPPLVSREALPVFTQRLVEHFAPEKVILFGLARYESIFRRRALMRRGPSSLGFRQLHHPSRAEGNRHHSCGLRAS